jgi:hypothetical protein
MLVLTTKIDTSGLDRYQSFVLKQLSIFVEKIAFDIQALAQYYVPVDQAAAKNSIFVSIASKPGEASTHAQMAMSAAQTAATENESRWGHKGRTLKFDLIELEALPDIAPYLAYISVAVIYGMALEFGTLENPDPLSVAATNPGARRPFLRPAIDEYEDIFFSGIKAILSV